MEQTKVTIHVAGADYTVITDDDPTYTKSLGRKLNSDMADIMLANSRLSTTQAAILLALEYADENSKSKDALDELRAQVKAYLEDSSTAKQNADMARRDVKKVRASLDDANAKIKSMQVEIDTLKAKLAAYSS